MRLSDASERAAASEPRDRSEPAKRRARARAGEFRLRQGYGGHRRSFSGGVPRGKAPRIRSDVLAEASLQPNPETPSDSNLGLVPEDGDVVAVFVLAQFGDHIDVHDR